MKPTIQNNIVVFLITLLMAAQAFAAPAAFTCACDSGAMHTHQCEDFLAGSAFSLDCHEACCPAPSETSDRSISSNRIEQPCRTTRQASPEFTLSREQRGSIIAQDIALARHFSVHNIIRDDRPRKTSADTAIPFPFLSLITTTVLLV